MDRYFIYCRKSSEAEDRQVLSIDSQVDEANRIAARRQLSTELFAEAKSARAPGRPVFTSMVERLERGEARGIITWKADRLARNPLDGGRLIWAMKQNGLEIITPTQVFRADDETVLLLYLEFGMAQKYSDDLSRNVKRGNRAKLKRGGWPGTAPQGYLNEKDRLESWIATDPVRFPLLKHAWELLLTGRHTVPQIWRVLHEEWGYRTRRGSFLAISALYTLFTNPFYCGLMERREGTFHGNHEPMITEAEYWRAQEILGRRGRPRPKRLQFAYRGLIHCGDCGCMVTVETKINRYGYRYTYYHCTHRRPCKQPSIEEDALTLQLGQYLQRLSLSPRFLDWAVAHLEQSDQSDQAAAAAVQQSLSLAIASAEKQRTTLTQLRIRDLISEPEFISERGRLSAELLNLEAQQNSASSGTVSAAFATLATFVFAARACEWFAAGDSATRREIIDAVGSNLRLKNKIVSIDARQPFRPLDERPEPRRTTTSPLEPPNGPESKQLSCAFRDQLPAGRALVDDVRTSVLREPERENYLERILALLRKHGVVSERKAAA